MHILCCSKRTYKEIVKRGRWSVVYIYIYIYIVLVNLMCIGIYILCLCISVDRNRRVQWCTCLWGLCCRMSILLLYCIYAYNNTLTIYEGIPRYSIHKKQTTTVTTTNGIDRFISKLY